MKLLQGENTPHFICIICHVVALLHDSPSLVVPSICMAGPGPLPYSADTLTRYVVVGKSCRRTMVVSGPGVAVSCVGWSPLTGTYVSRYLTTAPGAANQVTLKLSVVSSDTRRLRTFPCSVGKKVEDLSPNTATGDGVPELIALANLANLAK